MTSADVEFEEAFAVALSHAARIECSAEEYRSQLRGWIEMIRTEICASEEMDQDV